jgi:NTP pyrophosphatase (non-canonical NTP hydrolase)
MTMSREQIAIDRWARERQRHEAYSNIARELIRSYGSTTAMLNNGLVLAEEAGEAVQAMRRFMGYARTAGSLGAVAEELADVVITAYVTADLYAIDLADAVSAKLVMIEERGGK